MNRRDFFHLQAVTEGELDSAFDGAEDAIRDFAADIGAFGIFSGMVAQEHEPVANMTLDVTSGTAYDRAGRRIRIGSEQNISLALDEDGISTTVPGAGDERWISLFVEFDRELDDERTDGSNQQVFFIRNESYRFVVRQGATADIGLATRPGLDDDLVLLCDVRIENAQASIEAADISTSRRQVATVYTADLVGFNEAEFEVIDSGDDVQAAMAVIDAHLNNTGNKHPATAITTAATGWLTAATVQAMFAEIVADLADTGAATSGCDRIGIADLPNSGSWTPGAGTLMTYIASLNTQIIRTRAKMASKENTHSVTNQGTGTTEVITLGADEPAFLSIRLDGPNPVPGVEHLLVVGPPYLDGASWKVGVRNGTGIDQDYTVGAWYIIP
jgi:hypothetical protein